MCVAIVVEVRILLKYLLINGSTAFVSSVFKLYPLSVCLKKKWFLNFDALRRSRNTCLKAVATVPIEVGKVILFLLCCGKIERISKKMIQNVEAILWSDVLT